MLGYFLPWSLEITFIVCSYLIISSKTSLSILTFTRASFCLNFSWYFQCDILRVKMKIKFDWDICITVGVKVLTLED